MLQKFKITTCAFILCLFGLTLMTVSQFLLKTAQSLQRAPKWTGKPTRKQNKIVLEI